MSMLVSPYVFYSGPLAPDFAALVFNDAAPSVGAGASVPFPSELFDHNGWHNQVSNTSRLTVISGVTKVRVAAGFNAPSSVRLTRNGSAFNGGTQGRSGSGAACVISAITSVSAGDYFELTNFGGSSISLSSTGWLAIEIIDPATRYTLVQKTGTQALSSGSNTIAWDSEINDGLAAHDNVTNNSRLTVPASTTGLFRLSASLYIPSTTSTQAILFCQKNGASFLGSIQMDIESSGDRRMNGVSAIIAASASDYFTLGANMGASRTLNNDQHTWFQIEEIPSGYAYCLVSRSGSAAAVASGAAVSWNNEVADALGAWAVGDPTKIYVPSGYNFARVSFNADVSGASTDVTVYTTKNGGTALSDPGWAGSITGTFGNDYLNGIGAWVPVVPGDYFDLRIVATGASINFGDLSWFQVEFKA